MQLKIKVTLDNISQEIDANDVAEIVEKIVESYTGMSTSTVIYDNDGNETKNPLLTQNTLRKMRG